MEKFISFFIFKYRLNLKNENSKKFKYQLYYDLNLYIEGTMLDHREK